LELRRYILLPWLLSAVTMYGLSYLWHGVLLSDLQELKIPFGLYMALAGVVYLGLGLAITIGTHKAVQYEWISLKGAFPLWTMLLAAAVGFFVYLVIFVLGMSFAKSGAVHVVVDVLWQMFEQALGGLAASLGIIYDMHQRFMEHERAN
jgi:prepilin signal peptidase PulO-like enzyme (type II secretory pathway)